MAIAILVGIKDKLVGTGFIAGVRDNVFAVVTALHSVGNGQEFQIVLPPHFGDLSVPQQYPIQTAAALPAKFVLAEPLLDIAIFLVTEGNLRAPIPRFITSQNELKLGEDVLIVGYPFAVIGSFLETAELCNISALGNRILPTGGSRHEFIVSHQTYIGSSGSPVIRKSDGIVCGIVRGCLAPPGVISIGNLPLGTDSNVTYATSAHVIPQLIDEAFSIGR